MSEPRLESLFTRLIERPEKPREANLDGSHLPSYHELLDQLCTEFGVPGSPTFWEAIRYIKTYYQRVQTVDRSYQVERPWHY